MPAPSPVAEALRHPLIAVWLPRRTTGGGVTPLGLLALVIGAFGACSGQVEPAAEPVVAVQVATVHRVALERTVQAEAALFPRRQAVLTAKIAAPVRRFLADRGSQVHRGQVLAILENRDLKAAAEESEGVLDQARASYLSTKAGAIPEEVHKAQLEAAVAEQELNAQQKLYDTRQDLYSHGALARRELDEAAVALAQARTQSEIARKHLETLTAVSREQTLKSAEGQLKAAQGKYLGAAAQLGYSEIQSPIDGVVTDRPLYPGEMAGGEKPLITVMDMSSVIARAHVPQEVAALVKVGDVARITGIGDATDVPGTVTVVGPALDPNSTTVEIRVEASNPACRLTPGASVRLSIVVATEPDALVIPVSALLTMSDGTSAVMVASPDDHAHRRRVQVGLRQGNDAEIIAGLEPGERVVTVGAYGLQDGARLRVERAARTP